MSISNLAYIEDIYRLWKESPQSVSEQWQRYFSQLEERGESLNLALLEPKLYVEASLLRSGNHSNGIRAEADQIPPVQFQLQEKQRHVDALITAYRDIGVLYANINPLYQYETRDMQYLRLTTRGVTVGLDLEKFQLDKTDLDRLFYAGEFVNTDPLPLRQIIDRYQMMYCGSIGYEFSHIHNTVMYNWLLMQIESQEHRRVWSPERKIRLQKDLIKAEGFEAFVQRSFVGQKRFSLEGSEAMVPAVHYLIYTALKHNIKDIVLGMSHRGRLNLFTNGLRKPAHEIFGIFAGKSFDHEVGGTGDVKYHLGHSFDYTNKKTGKTVHISLVANPSHLEAVDPVVEGKTRGIQRKRKDVNRKKTLPLLIHGDAAFVGQGVVTETLNLSQLRGYKTGGTIHIVVNNQIGFTTASREARSTYFATDFAKALQVPIFHINGDDPEAVVTAVDIALEWRQKFATDVIVDIVGYRRRGHNESDEPSFTHPHMYSLIKSHPSVTTLYGKQLITEKIYSQEDQEAFTKRYQNVLKEELELARERSTHEIIAAPYRGEWEEYNHEYSFDPVQTAVDKKTLLRIGSILTTPPEDFHPHPKLLRLLNENKKVIEAGKGINWGLAEALSFGSLVNEGYHIRLSGEDSGRGTFSHRHAQWWDHQSEEPKQYIPLQHINENQAPFSVHNSPLSEFSVLGFEYGYSLTQPKALVVWEAQFGDFANGAQVVIDQFVSSGESKWKRASGLVMLLPHGYEGQGPEHSSAHLERYLSLCADNNMQIANCTTPAQFFHLLRRQVLQTIRIPLIVMSPKALLRHPEAQSTLAELSSGFFKNIITEHESFHDAQRLIICSGKVYYDLLAYRKKHGYTIPLIRLEQLFPFPADALRKVLAEYKHLQEVVWTQEEAKNHGAWTFFAEEFRSRFSHRLHYVGRGPSASPAQGSHGKHLAELNKILSDAFLGKK